MKIKVFKNPENYIIRDYDLTNCTVEEVENALDLHCESVCVDPDKAAVTVVEEDGWREKETIIKGTSTSMSMAEVAAELIKRQESVHQKINKTTSKAPQENNKNKKSSFANGYDYCCMLCEMFFSIQPEKDVIGSACYCPYCGEDDPIRSVEGLLDACKEFNIDSVNFYSAFPPDELIPQSHTGATPRQVSIIFDLVSMRRHRGLSLSVNDIAGSSDAHIEIVKKVFEEFHITETGGAE